MRAADEPSIEWRRNLKRQQLDLAEEQTPIAVRDLHDYVQNGRAEQAKGVSSHAINADAFSAIPKGVAVHRALQHLLEDIVRIETAAVVGSVSFRKER